MTTPRNSPRQTFATALVGGAILWICAALISPPARAACVLTGTDVECSGNDFDGFRLAQSLTIRIRPDAFIQNVITGDRVGTCPLSFPAIVAGASSSIFNEGIISTSGVCGFGISVDRNSSVSNFGTIRTADIISYGIVADENGTVRNAGVISTEFQGSTGIFGGAGMRVIGDVGSRISTTGPASSGVSVGASSSISNAGQISTVGDASHGIDAGSDSAIVNSGPISTSANNSSGVRALGGSLTNSGSIRSVLVGPAFALTPTVGVSIVGNTAGFTNAATGSVTATHIGVRLSGTEGAGLSNSGRIEVSPAIQFDGTTSVGGAAVLVMGSASLDMFNSGTIVAHGGIPAVRSLGPRVELRNSGTIVGDIVLSSGNDIVIFGTSSTIVGSVDFGGGDDSVVFQGGGVLTRALANVEFLSKSGSEALIFGRNLSVGREMTIFGGGGIVIDREVEVRSATTGNIGLIRGHGTLAGNLDNGGVVAPGTQSERGTLTVTGPFRQFTDAALAIRLSPDGTSDRLMVGGPATLSGTLILSYEFVTGGPLFQDGQRFEVLAPAGAALISTGQLTLAAPRLTFVDSALVNTAGGGLAVEMERRSYEIAGVTETQKSAARMLDRVQAGRPGPLAAVLYQLEVASPDAATETLAGFAPEYPGGLQNLGLMTLDRFAESLRNRAPLVRESHRLAWSRGFASSGHSRGTASPAEYDLHGAAAGLETGIGGLGLGLAIARAEGEFARGTDLANYDASMVALSAHYSWLNVGLDAAAVYGAASPEINRVRISNGNTETLTAETDVGLWSISVNGALSKTLGRVALTPHAGVTFHRVSLGAVDERRPLAIRTRVATAQSLRTRFGAGLSTHIGRVRPYGDLSMSVEVLRRQPRIAAALIGVSDSEFDLHSEARRRIAVEAEAGIYVTLATRLEAFVAGALTANDLLAGRGLSTGLTFRW